MMTNFDLNSQHSVNENCVAGACWNPEMETSEKHRFKVPPHRRRRPLHSHSFPTFIRILSQCQLHIPEQVATVQGDQLVENNDSASQGDLSVQHNEMRPEDGLSREKSLVNEDRGVVSWQDPGFRGEHMDVDASRDNVRSNGDQGNFNGINRIDSVVESNQNGGSDFSAFASLTNAFASINNSHDHLLKTNVSGGASNPVDNKKEKSSPWETDNTEMKMNGRESDAPVSIPVIVSSVQKTDACIENSGVPDKSSDLLREDVASLEKNIVSKGQVSGDLTPKEGGFSQNALHRAIGKENKSNGLFRSEVNILSTAIDVQMMTDNLNLAENRSELVYYGDIVADDPAEGQDCKHKSGKNRPRCGFTEANGQSSCPKIPTRSGGSTGENTVENQCSASTQKVTYPNIKKRKQGSGSEDRKAKKKKKEKKKRAEKDRKLGVNRLKLPPVTKPKTIKYCHHFVKGSCHEGEKCKFSHSKVPLTKSKACSHFARQSCMKGDDCSYDHQLSKYPCNNYLSTGSCSRGSNCMFSHDVVPVKEGSSAFEQQSISVKETSNLKKPTSKKNLIAKSCPSGISLSKNEGHNGRAKQTPKAISFLSHGKEPLGNMSSNGQGASSLKADNGAKVDQQRISGASDMVVSLNKNTQGTPAVPPQRVNFLSFGKAPFKSCSKISSFSSISNLETRNSPLSGPDSDDGFKVGSQIGRGASSIVQNLNEAANRAPALTPRGLCFLSASNHLNSSFNKKLAGSHLNETDTAQSTDKINGSVNNKVNSPDPVLPQISSSLPHKLSLGELIDARSKTSLNASQRSFLSNTPSSVEKAVRSTLTLAAKFESKNNKDQSYVTPAFCTNLNKEASSSQNQSTKATAILDLLFGAMSNAK